MTQDRGAEPDGAGALELTLTADEAGERLDRVLAARDLGFTRAAVQRLMGEGRVWLDGAPVAKDTRAPAGGRVRLEPLPPPSSEALPEPIPLDILFEDEHLLVVHKAAGMVVHPAAGHATGTLVNALLHHRVVERGEDPLRPGIVHRLDKDTSGVMVVALNERSREGLAAQFAAHTLERAYEALCLGRHPARASYDTHYGRHPVDRKRFSSRVRGGKRAVTHVRALETFAGASHVECRLETGRTHQIRVHLADAGHPLLGDPVYGRTPRAPHLAAAAKQLGRQALHARLLGFAHPITGEPLRFEAPAPADFRAALEALRGG